ncbi:TetR/AcrR family transcriptional regulator [Ktedonosporobacter rubrisoli]|nr:TetR/AcrR family transcriptional regulator [Ktedonosporobacter rubrisoli]
MSENNTESIRHKGGRPRSEQSREAILSATLDELADKSLQAMSLVSVAARAGVSTATIYRWWSSKDELVIEALKSIQRELPVVESGNLREDLVTLLQGMFQLWSQPRVGNIVLYIISEIYAHPQQFQELSALLLKPRREQFIQLITHAQARGEIREDLDPQTIFGQVFGPGLYHLFFRESSVPLPATLAAQIVDAALQGINR